MTTVTEIEQRTRAWKTPEIQLRAVDGGEILSGYAAVYNRYSSDLGGFVEQVLPGAFDKTISEGRDIYGLMNHDVSLILGLNSAGTMDLTSDVTGLRYDIQIGTTPAALAAREYVNRRELRGSSFSFRALSVEWSLTDQEYPLRSLAEVALYDVGPVTFPAYPSTREEGAAAQMRALRSLVERTGVGIDDLVAACEQRSLARLISNPEERKEPEQTSTPSGLVAVRRRQLDLVEKSAPRVGR